MKKWLNFLLRTLKYSLAGFLLLVITIMYTPLANILPKPLFVESDIQKADVIVVLGSGIYPNGELTWFSLLRTLKGMELYKSGYSSKILFSGYAGSRNLEKGYSLAKSMAEIAVRYGVPKEDILLEDISTRTYENAIETKKIMEKEGFKTALLVTSAVHMYRAKLVFEKAGVNVIPASVFPIEAHINDPIERLLVFRETMREYLGLVMYKMRGWI